MTKRILDLGGTAVSLYTNDKLTTRQIASRLLINIKSVHRLLRYNNVEIRGSKKNLLGLKFDRLEVVQLYGVDNHQKQIWNCKCRCGNFTLVRGSDLISKKIKSCGCLLRESSKENIKISHSKYPKSSGFKGIGDIPGGYLSRIRNGAMRRRFEYSVSKEYLWDMFLKQNRKCALSGVLIYFGSWKVGNEKSGTASLDRIDSTRGYVEGNVQWVHKDVNNIKQDYSVEELVQYCKLILDYTNVKNEK